MYIIGIDIGTTSICGVKIDIKSGKVISSKTVNSNVFIESENTFEKIQSPEKIYSLAKEILDSFVCDNTLSIGVTGQMHGIVYTDINGEAVSPLYTWQDERGNLPYKDTTYSAYLKTPCGYGNVTDYYNKVNNIRPKNAISHCTIHDYFVMKICKNNRAVMHSSDAASLGMYDLLQNEFIYDVNVDVVNDYHIAGKYKNIPVSVAIGDNQASVFSTLADDNDILFNVGTGSQVSVISNEIVKNECIETRPFFEGKYLLVGAALCGGRAYSMLKNFYSKIINYFSKCSDEKVYEIMDKMLENSSTSGLYVDTRFAGTRNNPSIMGRIDEISTENFSPEELTRGFLNGITEELYCMYSSVNIQKTGLVGSGNGIRKNKHLIKIVEEKFNAKMKIPFHLEEAAFGAALFSAISAGLFKNRNEAVRLIKYL
ncbi:MAG: hypothetical protein E7568_05695 [Ruminococcaceae bacterium]|nr:hypothetical protein [Oscillospiraceae bacterium]